MKIELNHEAAITSIGLCVVALALGITLLISGCIRDVDKAAIEAGLVQKQATGQNGTFWTKP